MYSNAKTKLFEVTADEVANKPFEDYLEAHFQKGGLFLDMGCGANKVHETFIGVDPYVEHSEVNVKAYMWDTPFDDNSVDLIICFSALEHVSKFNVLPTLKEFARIMKPGAVLGIIVPNLLACMVAWSENQTTGWEMDLIFGTQVHEGEYHRTGFSVPIIEEYFDMVPGLELLNIYDVNGYSQWNYGILARKLKN